MLLGRVYVERRDEAASVRVLIPGRSDEARVPTTRRVELVPELLLTSPLVEPEDLRAVDEPDTRFPEDTLFP